MFDVVLGVFSTFRDHPYLSIAIFVGIAVLAIWRFSENGLGPAIISILKVLRYIIAIPFEFMKTSLASFQRSEEAGAPYIGSRAYMLHKLNQIQFAFVFLFGIMILAAGLTMTAIAIYPKAEIARHEQIGEALRKAQQELKTVDEKIVTISSPDFVRTIAKKRAALTEEYQSKLSKYQSFYSNIEYTGPVLDTIHNAGNTEEFRDVAAQSKYISDYFADCPMGENWGEFTYENCTEMKGLATKLYKLKLDMFETEQALSDATYQEQNSSVALEEAKQEQQNLKAQVAEQQKLFDGTALTKFKWVKPHAKAAVGVLLLTIVQFLALIWTYALLAYFVSWIAHMMRFLERKADMADKDA